jgi:serine/threonine protein phosphatase PrpC
MELQIAVLSRTGARPVNEDAYGFWSNDGTCCCVLSDGAGGHTGGEVASKLAVKEVLEWFQQTPACDASGIAAALQRANAAIVSGQRQTPEYARMRATIVVLAVDSEHGAAIWGHIGDTRLYCFRSQRVIWQTRDHSVLQSMVDAGYLQSRDLRGAPQRNILLAALGDGATFEPTIEATTFPVRDGDVFLLCTDGWWELLGDAEMGTTLAAAATPQAWLEAMAALIRSRGRPGHDNFSAVAAWLCDPAESTRSMAEDDGDDEAAPAAGLESVP